VPRGRRVSKGRVSESHLPVNGPDVDLFVLSDGLHEEPFGETYYPSKLLARAAWQQVRVECRASPARRVPGHPRVRSTTG
jgi:hypothetical protein